MNHKNMTLAIATIVAAVAMTGIAFAIPQQALAYGHHHHHNNHSNNIKVNQDLTQVNQCANSSWCFNTGNNTVDIDR
jgi:hypothetical protein